MTERTAVPPGDGMGGLHQEGAEERAARCADTPLAMLFTRLDDRRVETGIAGHLFGPGEAMGIPTMAHVAAAPMSPTPVIVRSA